MRWRQTEAKDSGRRWKQSLSRRRSEALVWAIVSGALPGWANDHICTYSEFTRRKQSVDCVWKEAALSPNATRLSIASSNLTTKSRVVAHACMRATSAELEYLPDEGIWKGNFFLPFKYAYAIATLLHMWHS